MFYQLILEKHSGARAHTHTYSKTPVSSLTLRKPPPPIQDFSCRELPAWWSKKLAVRARGFIPKHSAGLHKVTTVGLKALTAAHIFWLNPEKSKKEPRGSQVAAASQQSTLSQRGGGLLFQGYRQRSVFPHEKSTRCTIL